MKKTRKGFTLVELVIVIAVIAILAAVLIPTFGGIIEKANENAAMQEARNAYTTYVSDAASEEEGFEKDVWVQIKGAATPETTDDVYVKVENGSPVKTKVGTDDVYRVKTAPTDGKEVLIPSGNKWVIK